MVKTIIKKAISVLFIILIILNLVACGFLENIENEINENNIINEETSKNSNKIIGKEESRKDNKQNIQDLIDKAKEKQELENNIDKNEEINLENKENINNEEIKEKEEKKIPKDDDLVLIKDYIPNIFIELRYATNNNFCNTKLYANDDAYLRYGTIKKLQKVQEIVNQDGYSLKIWDAYRPKSVQEKMWEIVPDTTYVANPYKGGSSHNRGNTIDITLVNNNGEDIPMPTDFDDFSLKADRDYSDVSEDKAKNAIYLENIMIKNGFKPYSGEWWHFTDNDSYPFVDYN